MRTKSVSESSLKDLIKNKKTLKKITIGLGILWILILAWIISIPKYKLLFTLFPLAITTTIPIFIFISQIDSEIKKRNSKNS